MVAGPGCIRFPGAADGSAAEPLSLLVFIYRVPHDRSRIRARHMPCCRNFWRGIGEAGVSMGSDCY